MKIILSLGIFFFLNYSLYAQSCPGSLPSGIDCVAHGTLKTVTAFTITKSITNNHASGKALMIPIGTSTQWSQFYSNPPSGVTVANPSYHLTSTGRCNYTGACWYENSWGGMRCSQPVDVGKIGTGAGCHVTQNIYTVSGQQATLLYDAAWGYTSGNGGCEYRCDYY